MDNTEIYTEEIIDHYRNPKRFGILNNADVCIQNVNPFCGDRIELYLKIEDNRVTDLKFSGQSCAISKACASMLYDDLVGKTTKEIEKIDQEYVLNLLGIPNINPIRLKCALLPLFTIKQAIEVNQQKQANS